MLKQMILAAAATFALSSAALAAPVSTTHASTTATSAHSSQVAASDSAAVSCRTHHRAGASCACSKAPGRTGTVERLNGHDTCQVAAHPHS